jgi:hypothetical protein
MAHAAKGVERPSLVGRTAGLGWSLGRDAPWAVGCAQGDAAAGQVREALPRASRGPGGRGPHPRVWGGGSRGCLESTPAGSACPGVQGKRSSDRSAGLVGLLCGAWRLGRGRHSSPLTMSDRGTYTWLDRCCYVPPPCPTCRHVNDWTAVRWVDASSLAHPNTWIPGTITCVVCSRPPLGGERR